MSVIVHLLASARCARCLRAGQLGQDAWTGSRPTSTRPSWNSATACPRKARASSDLYLTCAKFVTTPQYAPQLRERLCLERELADDARERGWEREVDRHQRIADRIRNLLSDLGEPSDMPEDTP